ncbi:MAG: type IV secretion system DNA-binding domain-containing protein [Patescibacteria group bacterium]
MWLFQLGVIADETNNITDKLGSGGFSWSWLIVLLIVSLVVVAALILRHLAHKLHELKTSLNMQVLLVTVPKDSINNEQQKSGKQYVIEQIGVAEVLWSALGGLRPQSGINVWSGGRDDHAALEIVVQNGLISFYVVVTSEMRSFLEQQILSHYPHANIEQVEDYNIFLAHGFTAGVYLKFIRPSVFPTKTYLQLEADSLNSITNTLSKIPKNMGAAIQLVVRSAQPSWRREGVRIASAMQQGKSLAQVHQKNIVSKAWRFLGEIFWSSNNKKNSNPDKPKQEHQLSPLEQEMVKGLEQKASKAGLDVTIRLVATALSQAQANAYLNDIANAFGQFSIYEYGNRYEIKKPLSLDKFLVGFIHRRLDFRNKLVLNTEELASIYHFPLATTETPNIRWLGARRAPAPVNIPAAGITLGINRYRGQETLINMKDDDRRRHVYIIGKSGTGKSVLMQNLIVQDIKAGRGVGVIDPHGELIESILGQVPLSRADDVVIFNPSDVERPIGLNMLEAGTPEQADFAVQEMISIFYKLVTDPNMIGPMFEHNMRNAMLTLMSDKEYPGTIAEIPRIFTDKEFQKYKLTKVTDPVVRSFWEKEMAQTTDFHKSEMLGYLISKVGRFVENEMMRNIIGQPKSGFNFRDIMDKQKILLVNLSKGTTGEVNSSLLGLIIVSKLQMAAMTRASLVESERKDFYLYIDEFQNFITDSVATILSEARKYRLDLIVTNQYLQQLVQGADTKIRDAILGTVGTLISFKIGVEDAELLAKEFAPVFNAYDLVNIEQYSAYVKLLVDNASTRPFNMKTLPPQPTDRNIASKLKELSRLKFGRPKAEVEAEIMERTKLGSVSTKAPVSSEKTL